MTIRYPNGKLYTPNTSVQKTEKRVKVKICLLVIVERH